MTSHPKPERTLKAPKRLDRRPKCGNCGNGYSRHEDVSERCPAYRGNPAGYSFYRRSVPVARKAADNLRGMVGKLPLVREGETIARTIARNRKAEAPRKARKIMPRCKHCAKPHRYHMGPGVLHGGGYCPGYAPALGIRQKRRTPAAAVKLLADGLWSAAVHARPGGCEIQQYHAHPCVGGFQAMHGIPRTFTATRFLLINGFKGCAGTHTFFTNRPEAWSAILLEAWGLETFRELWRIARAMQPVDMEATVTALRSEAKARGIEA